MNVRQALKIWLDFHRAHSGGNTVRAYEFTIAKFNQHFANLNINEVSTDDILDFMFHIIEGRKPQTKRIRFSHLTAFFNFLRIHPFHCLLSRRYTSGARLLSSGTMLTAQLSKPIKRPFADRLGYLL